MDLISWLVGAGCTLALVGGVLAARLLLARGFQDAPRPRADLAPLRELIREELVHLRLGAAALGQVEELVQSKTATLRADVNAIAESVDSNLDAIERTRKRVAARRENQTPQLPEQRPAISPAALAFLQGRGH